MFLKQNCDFSFVILIRPICSYTKNDSFHCRRVQHSNLKIRRDKKGVTLTLMIVNYKRKNTEENSKSCEIKNTK